MVRTANVGLTLRNWSVGAYIEEFEQNGYERAEYGEKPMPVVAERLNIPGLNLSNLKSAKAFALAYPQKSQTLSGFFAEAFGDGYSQIGQTVSGLFAREISQRVFGEFKRPEYAMDPGTLIRKLTFSHFVELLRLDDPLQRAFYEIEYVKGGWSVRELKRQIGSLLFERLGLSTDKEKLLRLTAVEVTPSLPADIIKDPYTFEFLGLKPKEVFRENDLETALLDHLQEFLLELGNGFCFEDRQKKIRIGCSDDFVDLVFYHRKLHCHVLIELKVEPFNYASAGQLNTYVNYYRKHEMAEGDNHAHWSATLHRQGARPRQIRARRDGRKPLCLRLQGRTAQGGGAGGLLVNPKKRFAASGSVWFRTQVAFGEQASKSCWIFPRTR